MPRIRTIKPDFFAHHELFELEQETGLPIRIAFAGLWTLCDREGRFKWRPPQLKLGCLPYDDIDFSRVLDALARVGFIVKYRVEGKDYGYVPSFLDHQVINNRESQSTLPEPNENNILDVSSRVDHASATREVHAQGERKGREGREGGNARVVDASAAREVIDYLNSKAGCNYGHVDTNLDLVKARLKEGRSVDLIKRVIDAKVKEWGGTDQAKYLRPATLFNKTKFEQYAGQLDQKQKPVPGQRPPAEKTPLELAKEEVQEYSARVAQCEKFGQPPLESDLFALEAARQKVAKLRGA